MDWNAYAIRSAIIRLVTVITKINCIFYGEHRIEHKICSTEMDTIVTLAEIRFCQSKNENLKE